MSDDLVKRLREDQPVTQDMGSTMQCALQDEAADRIEQLERENKAQAQEIDNIRRRSDGWQSMVIDCDQYLKPSETPAERIEREVNDCLAMMKLLGKKQYRIEQIEAVLRDVDAWVDDLMPYAQEGFEPATVFKRVKEALSSE